MGSTAAGISTARRAAYADMNKSVVGGTRGAVMDAAGGGVPPSRIGGKNGGTGGGPRGAGLNAASSDHIGSMASGAGGGCTSRSPGGSNADDMAETGRADGVIMSRVAGWLMRGEGPLHGPQGSLAIRGSVSGVVEVSGGA